MVAHLRDGRRTRVTQHPLGPPSAIEEGAGKGWILGASRSSSCVMAAHYLLCATHAASFRIEDGFCIAGPCVGGSLEKLELVTRNGTLFADLP
jgi:hypothetical protein